ncbi:MAG: hypothetical protein IPP81_20005 [Chitinophagaceae bacterium]|nr:hypothetical protein [Chitinophagaceae bacterium]
MEDVEIFEQLFRNDNQVVGKVAIIRGGLNTDNPTGLLNLAVSQYVENTGYNEFVEIFLDNPWVRVVMSGINEINFKKFENQKLSNLNEN